MRFDWYSYKNIWIVKTSLPYILAHKPTPTVKVEKMSCLLAKDAMMTIKKQLNGCNFLLKAIFGLNFSEYIKNETYSLLTYDSL